MRSILSIAENAVKFGEYLGAAEVEAYATSVDGKRIALTNGIETLYTSQTAGLGVRVIIGKKIGFFATSSLAIRDVKGSVEAACRIAKLSEPDKEWVSLPTSCGKVPVEGTFDREIVDLEPDVLVQGAAQILDTVSSCDGKLAITRGDVSAETVYTAIANSHGCSLFGEETFASASVSAKAEEGGMKGVSSESQQKRNWKELDCVLIAQTAADRASKVVYAKPIVGGKLPVVWCNKLFASILRIMFGGTLSADSAQRGRSPWAGKIGNQIASDSFSLIDDGRLKAGLGTREFDDDGIRQQKVKLIDRGALHGFLYDTYTANKAGYESTGNSSRDYRSFPSPQPNNLILQAGDAKEEELIEDVKKGIYLVETIGAWLSNPISGDLSATAVNAFLIENGELTKPVKGMIISGNFFDILRGKIDLIANDLQNSGSTYSPSVRVNEMMAIGE